MGGDSNADADAESLTECPDDVSQGSVSSRSSPVPPSNGTKTMTLPRKRNRSIKRNCKINANSKNRKQGGSRLAPVMFL